MKTYLCCFSIFQQSDASVESGRNKENKKKKSRLPKRKAEKGFLKPATPLARKPLVITNSDINDQLDA